MKGAIRLPAVAATLAEASIEPMLSRTKVGRYSPMADEAYRSIRNIYDIQGCAQRTIIDPANSVKRKIS